ncbi:MAG: FAD-dependent oxidoreductase, partial [Gemmatimonadota bacterium]|nr:FAD-dependent oxidoreductase [Gemmatimonadota bacterium]
AEQVIAAIEADPADAPLRHAPGFSTAELRHLVRTEQVVHLDDVLMRRTSLAFLGEVTRDAAEEIAEVVGDERGWDAADRRAEVDRALAAVHVADATGEIAATR